jgi:uncharacterized membrane protein YcjF (UPF0283 family)
MDNFLRYFYQDIGRVFRAFLEIFSAFFNFLNYLLNFPMRMDIIKSYESEFTTTDWVMLLVANVALILVIALLIWALGKLLRKIFRFEKMIGILKHRTEYRTVTGGVPHKEQRIFQSGLHDSLLFQK